MSPWVKLLACDYKMYTCYDNVCPFILIHNQLSLVFYTCSFPAEWIKGNGTLRGIGRNKELSDLDKVHIRKLYGPPRHLPRETNTGPSRETTTRPTTRPTTYICNISVFKSIMCSTCGSDRSSCDYFYQHLEHSF